MNLLNGAEVAKMVGVHPSSITRLKAKGYIKYADEQKKLYDLPEVERALAYYAQIKSGELINHSTAAEMLGVSKSTVTAMKERGELEVASIGGKEVFYRLKDIDRLISSKQKEGKAAILNDKSLDDLKKKKLELEVELTQHTLDERRGKVIPQEQVAAFVELLVNKIGQWSSDGAARINMQIRHCQSDEERLPKIQKEIDKFLDEFKSLTESQLVAG